VGLQAVTAQAEAMAYIDTPDGFTFPEAMQSRGTTGDFSTLDDGQKLLFPHFLVANPDFIDEDTTPTEDRFLNIPMSAFMAGLRAKVDLEEGWHVSSSNHRVMGVEGMDVDLSFSLGDPGCEANLLNSVGFVTVVSMFGNGIVEWGNYGAGFPGNTGVDAFECVRRTRAIMKRAIEMACVRFIDRPFIKANVDAIRNTVNLYLNQLVGQNKLVYGKCFYRPESNPIGQLAMGHLTFDIEFTPAIPMQRLTFTYKIDLNQLSNIL
jgi:phage tail sheath protein FI